MKSNRAKNNRAKKSFKEAVRGAKKQASYVGELSSGYDANTPGIDEDQTKHGKGHQEEVHKGGPGDGGAHFVDKRDEVSKAASNSKAIQKAAKDLRVVAASMSRAMGKLSSYIGELSSGYDANTPGIDEDQTKHGKGHQEEVHKGGPGDGGAHFDDKRDEVSKAAHSEGMRMLGQSLLKLEKEAKDKKLTDTQQSTLADTFKQLGREFDTVLDSPGAMEGEYKSDAEILAATASKDDEWISVNASSDDEWIDVDAVGHPQEDGSRVHTQYEGRQVDEDSMKAEKWYTPGPGEFEDPRDKSERATARETADHFS